jgi:tRNA-2-methylthio-N6-dimethylallyladenosine synthase
VKVERLQELNALVERKARERSARYAGRMEQILVEGRNPKDPEQVMGRTRTNRLTFFPALRSGGARWQPGDLVDVRIEEVRAFSLSGVAVATGQH